MASDWGHLSWVLQLHRLVLWYPCPYVSVTSCQGGYCRHESAETAGIEYSQKYTMFCVFRRERDRSGLRYNSQKRFRPLCYRIEASPLQSNRPSANWRTKNIGDMCHFIAPKGIKNRTWSHMWYFEPRRLAVTIPMKLSSELHNIPFTLWATMNSDFPLRRLWCAIASFLSCRPWPSCNQQNRRLKSEFWD